MDAVPISAVVPAYDATGYLAETLASVRGQTEPVDDVVVVDDGSGDETAAVARSQGARVVEHAENRGVAAARNTGVRAAENEWVAFLDADDLWKPRKIERQYDVVRRHPDVRVVFSDREHTRGGEIVRRRFLPDHPPYRRVEKTRLGDDVHRLDRASLGRALFPGNFLKPSTLLLHRDLFERVGGFDERFTAPGSLVGTCEDQDLALRLVVHTDPVVVEEPLVSYRLREGSVSSDTVGLKVGYAYLSDRVMAHPERYPEGAPEYFRDRKPQVLREAALVCMHDGDFETASLLLRRSLESRVAWKTLAALAACSLGERGFDALVKVKRALGLPGPR